MRAHPEVTVVVSTFNRRSALERMLCELNATCSSATALEVVVAIDGSTDGTGEALEKLETKFAVKVVELPIKGGPAAGRNRALAIARGDVVLFLDDDVMPISGLIERHLELHRTDPNAVGIGPMLPPEHNQLPPWLKWEAATLAKQYDAMRRGEYSATPRQFYTANASVRLTHIRAAGGFDEAFQRAEDVEFAYRLADRGLHFRFLPDAAVIHEPSRTWNSWQRVAFEYGRHAVIFERERRRDQLRLAFLEWPERHPLNRMITKSCVGHRVRSQVLKAFARPALQCSEWLGLTRVQMGICGSLYSTSYWQGVAEESGLGSRVWSDGPTTKQPALRGGESTR